MSSNTNVTIPFIDLKTQYKALKPQIDARIQKVLEHGAFISGPEVAELEKALCQFTGAPHALACSNGTDALLIPLMALGVGPGDEVITTAFSFIATAEVILLAGAKPVYVDIDPKTYNMDMAALKKAITPKTKAIVPVGLYGQLPNFDEIQKIVADRQIPVIEDAAQSFGATYKGKRSCNFTLMAGTSFFPAKPLGCYGDGGAIFTQDEKQYKAMKEIREHGSESRYFHTRLGMNARLDTLQCAILLAKLDRYGWEIEQRNRVAHAYNQAFSGLSSFGITTPFVAEGHQSVWAQYTLRSNKRDLLQKKMTELGVPTSIHYPRAMPDQPYYKGKGIEIGDLQESRRAALEVLSLPLYPDMTDEVLHAVIDRTIQAAKSI